MKRKSEGWIRVLEVVTDTDHRPIAQFNSSNGAIMIIVDKNKYCWIMGNATVKYVE